MEADARTRFAERRMKTIGKITSTVVSRDNRWGERGIYEIDIEIDEMFLAMDRDPGGYLKRCIATHLAGCAQHTGLPIGEAIWKVTLTHWTSTNFNLPAEFKA